MFVSDANNSTYRTWASDIIPDLALNKWTGINDKGLLQFKSTFFTSSEVSDTVLFSCDTAYHARYSIVKDSSILSKSDDQGIAAIVIDLVVW